MQNVQVSFDTSTNNARSESSVAINPNNPNQIVAASKKFANIHTYDFTLATEYSTDGGQTWQASPALALPAGATVMTDPPSRGTTAITSSSSGSSGITHPPGTPSASSSTSRPTAELPGARPTPSTTARTTISSG